MRVSLDKNDSAYDMKYCGAKIYLDGKEIMWCYTADDEKGYIMRCKTDEEGNTITHKNEIVTEELYGDVKIVMEEAE